MVFPACPRPTPSRRRRARVAWLPAALSTLLVAGCGLSGCQSMPGAPGTAAATDRPRPTPEHPYPPRTVTVPPVVLSRLARGIDLSFWFTYRHDPSYAREGYFATAADFTTLRRLGFTAVRIEIDPNALLDAGGNLKPDVLAELTAGVQQAQRVGLLTVLTNMPAEEEKARLATDDGLLGRYEDFWRKLAGTYRGLDPTLTVFEALNEPGLVSRPRTEAITARLLAAIRSQAPSHTVIMPGYKWDNPEDLEPIDAVADPNVIYTFHFYAPFVFTHQGAFWLGGDTPIVKYAGFPWPPTTAGIDALLPTVPPDVRPHLAQYGRENWSAAKVAGLIDRAVDWSRAQGGVPLWCGEFGALNLSSNEPDRARWIGDVRRTLESRGIGYGYFDFHSNFGLTGTGPAPRGTWDAAAVRGLGLTIPDDLGGAGVGSVLGPDRWTTPAGAPAASPTP